MYAKRRMIKNIFDLLSTELPIGWVAKFDNLDKSVVILGPGDAMIIIRCNKRSQVPVVGVWPKNKIGEDMDPYEWGVLDLSDSYPLTRLSTLVSTEDNIDSIICYISAYNSVYNKCLDKFLVN